MAHIAKRIGHQGARDLSFGRLVASLDSEKMPMLFRRFPELDYTKDHDPAAMKRAWERFGKGSAIEQYIVRRQC